MSQKMVDHGLPLNILPSGSRIACPSTEGMKDNAKVVNTLIASILFEETWYETIAASLILYISSTTQYQIAMMSNKLSFHGIWMGGNQGILRDWLGYERRGRYDEAEITESGVNVAMK
jgi:hypothetical protein